jgi:hypothetical protein
MSGDDNVELSTKAPNHRVVDKNTLLLSQSGDVCETGEMILVDSTALQVVGDSNTVDNDYNVGDDDCPRGNHIDCLSDLFIYLIYIQKVDFIYFDRVYLNQVDVKYQQQQIPIVDHRNVHRLIVD